MKRKKLNPTQLIVPGEYELGNKSILNIYFRVFNRGHGDDLPPVIVAHRGTFNISSRSEDLIRQEFSILVKERFKSGSEYFLLDGNHKAVAATLNHRLVPSLELEVDGDIGECKKMVETGDLFDWTIPGETLEEIEEELEAHMMSYFTYYGLDGDCPLTIKERIHRLISEEKVPEYIVERYLKGE